ncbi:MAG: YkgJ family cysteine cluster protein [Candidatus Omnitrophica bacterium]|nr:YkgJ family cysteine cluster protein [Candidatus Omnitrophota bacterium]
MQLKQLVPESFCLSCDVCCRFSEGYTVWSPLFTEAEIKHLVNKDILPPSIFTSPRPEADGNKVKHEHRTRRINLVAYKDYFICPCFRPEDKKCRIYEDRPFECRLYPFLLVNRGGKFYMAQDTKCPYLRSAQQEEIDSYVNYLQEALQADEARMFLKNSPQLFADYPAADLKLLFPINNTAVC